MATKQIEVSRVRTTKVAAVEPLAYVGCYRYDYGTPRVEIEATVEVGNTSHVVQLNLTDEGAKQLAKRLADIVAEVEAKKAMVED